MTAVTDARAALAPDPELPQRDALLDPDAVAERLAERLGRDGRLPIRRCVRLRAKYQVGRSLRVLHRIEVAGESHLVSARTFSRERSEAVYRRVLATAVATGALRPTAHDPDLATVFWTFPNDRKIATLPALVDVPAELARALPRRWTQTRLTAYAPEKSATARCVGEDGTAIAFAKVYAGDEGERTHRVHRELAEGGAGESAVRVARAVAYSREYRTLFVEPIEGRPIAELRAGELEQGLGGLGRALGALHRRPPPGGVPRRGRLEPRRLLVAAAVIGRARPDLATRTHALAGALVGSFEERTPPVFLHGDAHPQNGIMGSDGVVLIDLDQVCTGPAAADLGGLLATVTGSRCVGELSEAAESRLHDAVLAGYAESAPPPPGHSLRWHVAAALLVERALRSVQRVREESLEHLDTILEAAEASCP
ncbi:MAG: phosphotransferase [Solirubrobacterales bacterium]